MDHPEWSRQKMADEIGHSKSWVKKWLKRIRSAPLEDREICTENLAGENHRHSDFLRNGGEDPRDP